MTSLQVEPSFRARLGAVNSFAALLEHFSAGTNARGEVFVTRAALPDGTDVFFKLYRYKRPSWRFWRRASKARREYGNYALLSAAGVRVAQRVAIGEERDAIGRLKQAFIITVTVPGARTLIQFAEQKPSSELRKSVFGQLAQFTRAMHASSFFYHDLVWRNVLVNDRNEVVLIDCPRGDIARFGKERQRLRDLASLDKSAWKFCRRSERLRFLLNYLGTKRVDENARLLIHACLDYRRTRWPEDWGGR
jgi:hypothetical protein